MEYINLKKTLLTLDLELLELILRKVLDEDVRRICVVNTHLWNFIHENKELQHRLKGNWTCENCEHENDLKHKTCCFEDEYCIWCQG